MQAHQSNESALKPEFDLEAYFNRIGYSGIPSATFETLCSLHFHHALTIPFENLNPLLGWAVPLDIESLQRKIIRERRGGYCYEQNFLFRHALHAIGFEVTGLAARVVYNLPDDVVLPRTHMLIRIDLEGQAYIADVGFGGLTLTAPLRLEPDLEQSTPHEAFRLVREGNELIEQAKIGDSWKSLYRFTLERQFFADYEMANYYVSCHPRSRFVNGLIAARAMPDRRYALLNNELKVHYLNGRSERQVLTSVKEIRDVLQGAMGINLPDAPELDKKLLRLIQAAQE
jgi:N-hydroxyarylamine O-acetyltransferase